jgi:hypothetical protein
VVGAVCVRVGIGPTILRYRRASFVTVLNLTAPRERNAGKRNWICWPPRNVTKRKPRKQKNAARQCAGTGAGVRDDNAKETDFLFSSSDNEEEEEVGRNNGNRRPLSSNSAIKTLQRNASKARVESEGDDDDRKPPASSQRSERNTKKLSNDRKIGWWEGNGIFVQRAEALAKLRVAECGECDACVREACHVCGPCQFIDPDRQCCVMKCCATNTPEIKALYKNEIHEMQKRYDRCIDVGTNVFCWWKSAEDVVRTLTDKITK